MGTGNDSAAAVVHKSVISTTTRLPNKVSIFRAELYAISLTMALIRHSNEKNFIIFSDSTSSLKALSGFQVDLDLVYSILKDYTRLASNGKTIVFCWILSHISIRGNERADAAAKSVLTSPITNMKFPACKMIPCFDKFCLDEWQDIWDYCRGNRLHAIYPSVCTATHSKHSSRYNLVLLNRLNWPLSHNTLVPPFW